MHNDSDFWNFLIAISTALIAVSAICTAWVAYCGINVWKKEHTGKRNIELAEDTLALFYEANEAIKSIRYHASSSHETENIKKGKRETEAKFNARKDASVVFYRFDKYQELFSKIHASRYRFMAQIGKPKAAPFDELRKIENDIILSARRLTKLWGKEGFANEKQENYCQSQIDKYEAIFWDLSVDDDPINLKLCKIIEDIEKICNSVIGEK